MKLEVGPVPLASIVAEVVEIFEFVAQEKSIAVTNSIPSGLIVHADKNRLRQVLINLLDNAIKYTPEGGSVVTSAEERNGEICITVRDTGAGIPAEEVPRIWGRLYRGDKSRAQRGLGLGLSLVKAITLAHHGTVDVESTVGQGSSFSIRLPLAQT
jgi:signal transduction histidine kinase